MTRWVLLRGLTREAAHWGEFAERLAQRTGQPVLRPDLPGNGTRWREASPVRVASLARDVRRQLGTHGGPTVVVAMSLGAMVALEWARSAPQDVQGCVLVNTSAAGASAPWERLQPAQWPRIARMLLPGQSLAERERQVLAMTSARAALHAHRVAEWASLAGAHPVRRLNALRQLWAAATWRAPRERPPVPLLLLAGEGDRLVAPACSQRLAQRWQVPLQLHPWAGHDLPLDDPDWVLAQVTRWWQDGDRASD